jgi:hypothetical protein
MFQWMGGQVGVWVDGWVLWWMDDTALYDAGNCVLFTMYHCLLFISIFQTHGPVRGDYIKGIRPWIGIKKDQDFLQSAKWNRDEME